MSKIKKEKISAKGFDIEVYTDDPRFVIQNWMRNRNTLEFIGLWEVLNNPKFNRVQFDTFRWEQLNNPDFNPIEFEGYLKEFLLRYWDWDGTKNLKTSYN